MKRPTGKAAGTARSKIEVAIKALQNLDDQITEAQMPGASGPSSTQMLKTLERAERAVKQIHTSLAAG